MKAEPCPCGVKSCTGNAPTHDRKMRERVKALTRQVSKLEGNARSLAKLANAKLPDLERCEETQAQVLQFNAALEQWKRRASLLDVDLSQRYILIQELTLKLASVIGSEDAEAFVRAAVPAPFVRTLGPLEPIFRAMYANEKRGQEARTETELPLPDGFFPQLTEYKRERLVERVKSKK